MKWHTSPLAATAVVALVLAALAIPLHRLTTGRVVMAVPTPAASATTGDPHGAGHVHEFDGVLRVRLLAAAESLTVATTAGDVLWQTAALDPGEHETDVGILLVDDALELHIEAAFGEMAGDTALFLTVLPDGIEEKTHYAIGSGIIDEILFFEWDLH